MFNWHFLSILNGLDVIRLFIWLGFPYWGRNCGGNWAQWHRKVKWEKNICWEGTSLRQTASLEPLCVKVYLSVWPVQVSKKTNRIAGRKKSNEVYILRMRGATPSGWMPIKLDKCVRLTDVIKRAKFHRYNLRDFGAVRCWSFHIAIGRL